MTDTRFTHERLQPVETGCDRCGEAILPSEPRHARSDGVVCAFCDSTDATIVFEGFTEAELSAAFNSVADPDDWKAPVDAVCLKADRERVKAAVIFYTATEPMFFPNDETTIRVEADGYRAGPAGP